MIVNFFLVYFKRQVISTSSRGRPTEGQKSTLHNPKKSRECPHTWTRRPTRNVRRFPLLQGQIVRGIYIDFQQTSFSLPWGTSNPPVSWNWKKTSFKLPLLVSNYHDYPPVFWNSGHRLQSVPTDSNLWPQNAICSHRFKSVPTDSNLWPQIQNIFIFQMSL